MHLISLSRQWQLAATLAIGMSAIELSAIGREISIAPREVYSEVLSGKTTEWTFYIRASQPLRGRVDWSFSVMRRVVARGEHEVEVDRD